MAPFEWALTVGTVWQLTHAIALESAGAVAPWFTCARCTPATPVAVATAGGEEAWFGVRSGDAHAAGRAVAGRAGGRRDHRDGSVDVGGERRAGDGAGGGGELGVAGAVAGGAGGVGRVAEASGRVAVAGGAVHRRVGVPGDGGGRGAGERGVAAVAPGRRAGERRAGDRRRRDEPLVEASVPQATATVPLAWVVSFAAGIGPWHSVQERPAVRKVGVRWRRCAPTPRDVVSALPDASTAVALKPGAEVALVLATAAPAWPESTPWHAVQPLAGFWMVPSTWVAAVTVVAVVPVWQRRSSCWPGGASRSPEALPWQAVQPSLPEVAQEMAVALWLPPGKLPWQ